MWLCFLQIPPDSHNTDPSLAENQTILSLTVSPSEETLVAATNQSQLYSISLSSADLGKGDCVIIVQLYMPYM